MQWKRFFEASKAFDKGIHAFRIPQGGGLKDLPKADLIKDLCAIYFELRSLERGGNLHPRSSGKGLAREENI